VRRRASLVVRSELRGWTRGWSDPAGQGALSNLRVIAGDTFPGPALTPVRLGRSAGRTSCLLKEALKNLWCFRARHP
jgi:hypothetical protein